MRRTVGLITLAGVGLCLHGCDARAPNEPGPEQSPSFARASSQDDEAIAAIVAQVNAYLEEQGANYRLAEVWMFTRGYGRPAFRVLQEGTRWVPGDPRRNWSTEAEDITYVLDGSDFTADVPAADAEAALVASFDTWSNVPHTFLDLIRVEDDEGNHDLLDNYPAVPTFPPCTFPAVFDPGFIGRIADVTMGGWLPREYFDCIAPDGGEFILGTTWTFVWIGPAGRPTDVNNDGYVDTAAREIYYNEEFDWVTSGAVFLGPGEDIESISVHENGHAVDLGHFGGPPPALRLHPHQRIFSPEAVMNPGYFGGEKRELYPIDNAGYRTLWAQGRANQ